MYKISLIALISGIAGGVLLVILILRPAVPPDDDLAPAFEIDPVQLQSGDLIFRRGQSFTSRIVLTADKNSIYSHVGVLRMTEEGPQVIHAAPGERFNKPELVKAEPLAIFMQRHLAEALTIRRLENAYIAARAAEVAWTFAQDSVFFDAAFDLESPEKMYCTELVWLAFREVGIDLIDGVFDTPSFPLGKGAFILPSSLLNSPYVHEVLTLPPSSQTVRETP